MLLQLDLYKILTARIPAKKRRLIPKSAFRMLERMVHQDELNEMLRACYPHEGSDFAKALMQHMGVSIEVKGLDKLPKDGRYIFASNHPLGGLDGVSLISVLGSRYGDEDIYFLVNDLLMNITPLKSVFLPINKYGGQARGASEAINAAYEGAGQIVIFPAGLVSRLQKGVVKDLPWHKAFVAKAVKYKRDIVPVHFEGLNRKRFYRFARLRKKLGIKVNIEQAMLPAELCAAKGGKFRVVFGEPISWETLPTTGATQMAEAQAIKEKVYEL